MHHGFLEKLSKFRALRNRFKIIEDDSYKLIWRNFTFIVADNGKTREENLSRDVWDHHGNRQAYGEKS